MKDTKIIKTLMGVLGIVLATTITPSGAQQWIKPQPPSFKGWYVGKKAKQIFTLTNYTPVILTGNIIKKVSYTRYIFKDSSGEAPVHIPQYVFGLNRVYADTKVKLTGQVLGKYPIEYYDPHARIYYLEILK